MLEREVAMSDILSVKLDFLFKLIFGDERNKDILANFLSAVLEIPVDEFYELQILNNELKKEHEEDKLGILDINVRTKSGTLINLEIQVLNKKDYERRTVYYTAKRLVEQLGESDPYTKLVQTISINIIDYDLFDYEKFHSTFWLTEEVEGVKLTDVIRIDFLELQKARNTTGSDDMKQLWMDFLNAKSEEELRMLAQKSEVFIKPAAEVVRLSGDISVRELHFKRQMAIMDRMAEMEYATEKGINQGIKEGLEKGIAQGIAQGKAEGKAEGLRQAARSMKAMGISISAIAEATGLTPDEIEKL